MPRGMARSQLDLFPRDLLEPAPVTVFALGDAIREARRHPETNPEEWPH
jgi:hypothetical protein